MIRSAAIPSTKRFEQYEAMVSVYRRMDYDLVELPCAPVVERVRLVIAAISAA